MEYNSTPWNMAFFLFILLIHESSSAALSQPRDVRVESYNMDAVLKWRAPENPQKDLVYTVQIRPGMESEAIYACNGTKEQQCDIGPHIGSCFAHYTLRVRTELQGSKPKWSKPVDFTPQMDTVIGPPKVGLHAKDGAIEMTIKDPLLRVRSPFTECYEGVTYNVQYWKAGQENEEPFTRSVTSHSHTFRTLESGASYCFKVRVITRIPNKANYTEPMCETTSGKEKQAQTPGGTKLVSGLAAMAVLLPVLLLTAWLIHRGRRFLNPKVSLPPHFKQAPGVSYEDALTPPEQYDTISSLYEELAYHDITCQTPLDGFDDQSPYCNITGQSFNQEFNIAINDTQENCDDYIPQYGNVVVDTCHMPYRNI